VDYHQYTVRGRSLCLEYRLQHKEYKLLDDDVEGVEENFECCKIPSLGI
jgi:hypothetical protein